MSRYSNRLAEMGIELPQEAITDRILQSLPPSYKSFVLNYNMQGMTKSPGELFAMLKVAESELRKEHQVLMVNKTTSFKKTAKARRVTPRRAAKLLSLRRRKPRLDLTQKLSVIIARGLVTESETGPSI